MLRTLTSLNRKSGGTIPAGAILLYSIVTEPLTKEVTVNFQIFYDQAAVEGGKPPIPFKDIVEMEKEGSPVKGGKITPVDQDVADATTMIGLTDDIAKTLIEGPDLLGPGSVEAIGDTFPV